MVLDYQKNIRHRITMMTKTKMAKLPKVKMAKMPKPKMAKMPKMPKTKLPKPAKRGPVGTSAQKGALGATSAY